MAGNRESGRAAAQTIKAREPDFYKRIGSLGNAAGDPKVRGFGFGELGRQRASIYGKIGGRIGKRGKATRPNKPRQLKHQRHNQEVRLAEAQEASQMQTSKLSEKYGQRRPW